MKPFGKFFKGVWREYCLCFRLSSAGNRRQWQSDPYLKRGSILANIIIFGAALAVWNRHLSLSAALGVLVPAAIVGYLVWFGYAAWARDRAEKNGRH